MSAQYSISDLQKISLKVRQNLLKMIFAAKSGHPAGSLSATDILVSLYFSVMNHDPKNPSWEERDRFILSNGHTCPALYAVLAEAGYFPKEKLVTYAKLGSPLQGHPERTKLPGIETTSGSLGMGLGQASGYALAAKMDDRRFRIYCLVSDAEHDEGSHWEVVLVAAKYKLSNLTLFVDQNKIQIDGKTEEVLPLKSLLEKYRAFGWNALEIDGHNFSEIIGAVEKARSYYEGPSVIIAQTIAGKGVSFMEENSSWHAKVPSKEELEKALKELK